jgi:hypothetical protein
MQRDGHQDSENTQRINAKEAANVEVSDERETSEMASLHRVHEYQRSVNEEEKNSEYSYAIEMIIVIVTGEVIDEDQ